MTESMYYSDSVGLPRTDWKQWRLVCDEYGGTTWKYLDKDERETEEQSTFVKYLLKQDFEAPEQLKTKSSFKCAKKGLEFFSRLQEDCGIFPVQYKGPMFMTIGYLAANYYAKLEIPEPFRIEMIRYIVNNAHPVDGGWGLYSDDKSTCFGTTMNYVCLRLLGLPASHPVCLKARKTLLHLGGAIKNPHWGKAWLSVLNLYKWEGVNPAPPDLWLLPYSLPFHPGRWWVHTRAIYIPLAYLSSYKVQCSLDPLLEQIREEIYLPKHLPFDSIDFSKHRNDVCGVDLYYPHSSVLNFLNWTLTKYEKYIRPDWLLKKANEKVYDLIKKECDNTDYLTIAPISFAFDMVVAHFEEGPDSFTFRKFVSRMNDVLFMGPQGMTVMGTNGVQCWDLSFALQYSLVAGLGDLPEFANMIEKGFMFLVKSQITEDCVDGSFRDKRKGAWPFSTKTQGYTVSDCTAEALKAIVMTMNHPNFKYLQSEIPKEKLFQAIDILLSLQNRGRFEFGSFATYEKIRSTDLLELLNPAEVFNNIMVEYPYVECTDSSVLGLAYFSKFYPFYRTEEVKTAIADAIESIKRAQKQDGSWYGCWGVCFTYASMFALEAFHSVGMTYENSENVRKGCDFLISKQLPDGGWSESMKSCETHTYINSAESLVVQTSWAIIGLILAKYPKVEPIKNAVQLLMERQKLNGEWIYESIEGVFNHSCGIEYPNYRFMFPIKALGLFTKEYGDLDA